ncbi:hypothetical protein RYH73_07425 [Olivibacter sp. CPCC 100613]|uniref:hypothetical protein n=1 Tax=Olivibacter sp. CPCC 100613 TaxID=3079931 RepID=UPI002FF6F92B
MMNSRTKISSYELSQLSDSDLIRRVYEGYGCNIVNLMKPNPYTQQSLPSSEKLTPAQRAFFIVLHLYEQAHLSLVDFYSYSLRLHECMHWRSLKKAAHYFKLVKLEELVDSIQYLLMVDPLGKNGLTRYAFKQIHTELLLDAPVMYSFIAQMIRDHHEDFLKVGIVRRRKKPVFSYQTHKLSINI